MSVAHVEQPQRSPIAFSRALGLGFAGRQRAHLGSEVADFVADRRDDFCERLVRLNHVPKRRVATKPSRSSKERRIAGKKLDGVTKRARGKVRGDE